MRAAGAVLLLRAAGAGAAAPAQLRKTVDADNVTAETRACPPGSPHKHCDTSLSVAARVDALIALLNQSEIPPLLTAREGGGGSPGPSGAVARIGLPEYDWGLNCIHGVQSSCVKVDGETLCPTSFPNPVNLGAAWNETMWREMGAVIGREARALWVRGATEESSWSGRPHIGLDCWSPNININRDPRWGRNQEVPGEDPYLNGRFGVQYTLGLQESPSESRYLQAISTLKHWDAYSLENSAGFTRHSFDAQVRNATLQDTYFPAFKATVKEGRAAGVMCSYNSINGVPTCASPMLNKTLRGEWGFDGYVTSDTGAVSDISGAHKYAKSKEEAACRAIHDGGCDIDSGSVYHDALLGGVSQGLCSQRDLTQALRHTLGLRFRLGLFDPIDDQPLWRVPAAEIGAPANVALSRQAARESMVLLRNTGGALPLKAGVKLAVVGPHAKATTALAGNYLGQLCTDDKLDCIETPVAALTARNAGGSVAYVEGCGVTGTSTDGIAAAVAAAQAADAVVVLAGIDEGVESESRDRSSVALPGVQGELLRQVLAAAAGKPSAVVLVNGGMVALDGAADAAGAVLEAFYPGQYGAGAIADTLFGLNDRLGGKMPFTTYPMNYTGQISMAEMEMNKGGTPGRSYRYYAGPVEWAFGHGISLTTFTIERAGAAPAGALRVSTAGGAPRLPRSAVTYKVTNTGARAGDEVVMAFHEPAPRAAAAAGNCSYQVQGRILGASSIKTVQASSAADCCAQCAGAAGCVAYTYATDGSGSCYLKDNAAEGAANPDRVSGTVAPPPPDLPLLRRLVGFRRVHLLPGESATVSLPDLAPADFAEVDFATGDRLLRAGDARLVVTDGAAQRVVTPLVFAGPDRVTEPFAGR